MGHLSVLDTSGTMTRVNPATERLFGCTSEDLVGENFRDFLPPDSTVQFETFLKELAGGPNGQRQL